MVRKTKIRRVSKEREKQWWKYLTLRTEFLATHPNCQFNGCTSLSEDVHHKKGRLGRLLLNRRYWMACCRPCHDWIESNKREARKLKYILYSLLLCLLYSTAYADLGYTDNDGNLLPDFRVKNTDSIGLRSHAETDDTLSGGEARESNGLNNTESLHGGSDSRGGEQTSSTRKEGDVKCLDVHAKPVTPFTSSAASNVQSADAACPQSGNGPVTLGKPKILESIADIFARVELEYAPWYPVPNHL